MKALEECPICADGVVELHTMEQYAGKSSCSCSCTACELCISRWVDEQLPRCKAQGQLRVDCFCLHKTMPQAVVLKSKAADALADELEHTFLVEALGIVEVRRLEEEKRRTEALAEVRRELGALIGVVRPCPNCGVLIEKNGGCDNMYCTQCRRSYTWSSASTSQQAKL